MNREIKGLIPPGIGWIADNIISKGNILGTSNAEGGRWAKGLNLPKGGETVFFAGCGYQYTSGLEALLSLVPKMDESDIGMDLPTDIASFRKKLGVHLSAVYRKTSAKAIDADTQYLRDAIKVLGSLGVKFGYLAEDEPCCGGPLYFFGLQKEFVENAREVYKKLKSLGVRRIIGIVPSCTYTLRNLIPDCVEGYDLEIRHWSEVVLENIESKQLRLPEEVKVTYHDPCLLSRYLEIIEQPREILRAIKGVELVEPEWSRGEWTTCCGGGVGFEAVFPELSRILAVNRIKELTETGAEIIVTQCPGCIMRLKRALEELKIDGVKVLDLSQIVAIAMEV